MATSVKSQIRPRGFKVTLTNTEVLALPTTAITVGAAPGVGRAILFDRAFTTVDDAGGAYTNVDAAGFLRFAISTLAAGSMYGSNLVLASDGLIGTAIRTTQYSRYSEVTNAGAGTNQTSVDASVLTALENLPLVIGASNAAAGNFTGGNAANVFTCYVYYFIVNL